MSSFLCVIMGVFVTTLPVKDYLLHPNTWTYLLINISLVKNQYHLPGVFNGTVVNGSLWTILVKVKFYIALMLLYISPALKKGLVMFIILLAFFGLYIYASNNFPDNGYTKKAMPFCRLGGFFIVGCCLALNCTLIPFRVFISVLLFFLSFFLLYFVLLPFLFSLIQFFFVILLFLSAPGLLL